MNYYNLYGNFCMEYPDDTCEVVGIIVIDAKEMIWRMRVPKTEANNVSTYELTEHYWETKYAETVEV